MHWAQIKLLNLLAVLPFIAVFYFFAIRAKRKAIKRFASAGLLKSLAGAGIMDRQKRAALFVVLGTFFLIIAMARPQFGAKLAVAKRKGIDIIVALDISDSMLAEDIKPDRLEAAKREISGLIRKLKGDRIGIVCFAGRSFLQCPLTLDYDICSTFLNNITTDYIPVGGTAIARAIETARNAFIKNERKHKVLIIITDGEDHEGDPVRAAEEAKNEGIRIFTIGVGSLEGVPIPVKDAEGNITGYKKDASGAVVISKLDEYQLQKIALTAKGAYFRSTTGQMELDKIYEKISSMEKKELADRIYTRYQERFRIPLAIALLFLAADFAVLTFVKNTKNKSRLRRIP